jgi:Glycosyl hydrolase 108
MESNTPNFTNDFMKSLKFVLKWEGGYVNDPQDPGGETKWGISKRSYPHVDISALTPDQAARIYFEDYWLESGCDKLDSPFNTVVFDTAVNCGVGRARRWCGECKTTGAFLEARKQHYISLINKNDRLMKYWRGWMNRWNDLRKFVDANSSS